MLSTEIAVAPDGIARLDLGAGEDGAVAHPRSLSALEPERQPELFPGRYDEIWKQDCPTCGCRGFATGEQSGEQISKEPDEQAIGEIIEREFIVEEFRCPTCELALRGSDQLEAAGINYIHEDCQERELEYEPDYGND